MIKCLGCTILCLVCYNKMLTLGITYFRNIVEFKVSHVSNILPWLGGKKIGGEPGNLLISGECFTHQQVSHIPADAAAERNAWDRYSVKAALLSVWSSDQQPPLGASWKCTFPGLPSRSTESESQGGRALVSAWTSSPGNASVH